MLQPGLADEEVGEDDDDRPPGQSLTDEPQRGGEVRAPLLRLERDEVAHQAKRVGSPPRRRHVTLDGIREEGDADPMIAPDGREREDAGDLDGFVALGHVSGPERAGGAHVDHEHHRQLPLLAVLLDERVTGARGRAPVDGPDVVARLVFADLVEVHPAAAEARLHAAVERVRAESTRADLDAPDAIGDPPRHVVRRMGLHGDATVWRTRLTISSPSTPLASASKLRVRR